MEFEGLYKNDCVATQKFSFPSIGLWNSELWDVDKYCKELGIDSLGLAILDQMR
jgi:hypothetical protein